MQSILTIEEIRKTRAEISRKCKFDPKQLVAYYIKRQDERKCQQDAAADARKLAPLS
jgi:hypothetical protein